MSDLSPANLIQFVITIAAILFAIEVYLALRNWIFAVIDEYETIISTEGAAR